MVKRPRDTGPEVEDALAYLEEVKTQFEQQPHVYNEFLEIMKDFKQQLIDTPGVIARVSQLFHGHPQLIMGFNQFLPPGSEIQLAQAAGEYIDPAMMAEHAAAAYPAAAQHGVAAAPTMQVGGDVHAAAPGPVPAGVNAAAVPRQPVELDHAVNYVTKIRERFINQPEVYKAFLDILHTYHKEQRSISEVYEQVAYLFRDNEDLLGEFTQFLPDPAAGKGTPKATRKSDSRPSKKQKVSGRVEKDRSLKKGADKEKKRRKGETMTTQAKQLVFFDKVKSRLGPEMYEEFLKCLSLFSQQVFNRDDVVALVNDLLGRHHDLLAEFKTLIGYKGGPASMASHAQAQFPATPTTPTSARHSRTPLSELDLTHSQRCGPSYRRLPKSFVSPRASGRTQLCKEVLNDIWVSVPTGSEDFQFQAARKNQYEDSLFKCEDERFELDMVIENNAATMRVIEPLVEKIESMTPEEQQRHKPKNVLKPWHIRSIERLYGDRGQEIIEGMKRNPVVSLPLILKRLKQKNHEWQAARKEFNRIWRDVNEKNYFKSLDHRSPQFKASDKKLLSVKGLLTEIRDSYLDARELSKKIHLEYDLPDPKLFPDIISLVSEVIKNTFSAKDRDSANEFWTTFLSSYFSPATDAEKQADAASEQQGDAATEDASAAPPASADTAAPPSDAGTSSAPVASSVTSSAATTTSAATAPAAAVAPGAGDASAPAGAAAAAAVATISQEADNANSTAPMDTTATPNVEASPAAATPGGPVPTPAIVVESAASQAQGGSDDQRSVRPLAVKTDVRRTTTTRVFFGNNTCYVFLRLYQILYRRLAKAKELAKDSAEELSKSLGTELATELGVSDPPTEDQIPDPNRDYYAKDYLKALTDLVSGEIDVTTYEDTTRNLFGINSYWVCTVDKLVSQIAKQLQAILTCGTCTKLLQMYGYESCRSNGIDEAVYLRNALSLLGTENCYRFAFHPTTGHMTIQLLEEEAPAVDPSVLERVWNKYVEEYMTSEGSKVDLSKRKVFLLRSLRKTSHNNHILDGTQLSNGLVLHVNVHTLKFAYQQHTEDYFYRNGSVPRARAVQASAGAATPSPAVAKMSKRWSAQHSKLLKQAK